MVAVKIYGTVTNALLGSGASAHLTKSTIIAKLLLMPERSPSVITVVNGHMTTCERAHRDVSANWEKVWLK